MGQTSRENFSVVLRRGRTRSKMRGAVLRIGKQKDGATIQGLSSLFGRSPNQKGRIGKQRWIVRILLPYCIKMLVLGTNWSTWHSVVSQQTGTICHEIDSSMWQATGTINFLPSDFRQYRHVGNAAQHCRLELFQDSDFAGDLEDSKSTSGGVLCIFGSWTILPISWMCKKQTSVTHSSTVSEIISLDAGLRMDGSLALDLWDLVWSLKCSERPKEYQNQPKHAHGKPVLRPKPHPRLNKCWIRMWIYRT